MRCSIRKLLSTHKRKSWKCNSRIRTHKWR